MSADEELDLHDPVDQARLIAKLYEITEQPLDLRFSRSERISVRINERRMDLIVTLAPRWDAGLGSFPDKPEGGIK